MSPKEKFLKRLIEKDRLTKEAVIASLLMSASGNKRLLEALTFEKMKEGFPWRS
ncbi:hypothetical protein [Thermicanus aegyptius]|uniref:hypothetical protein n=1 Tax=Thermicanus aegyptius TaxID=94009 RepID=UPI000406F11F|nr:hypothetical protein [Thermicanus aegyptius]